MESQWQLQTITLLLLLCSRKKRLKRKYCFRPSLASQKKYCASDLLSVLQRNDQDLLSGELRTDSHFKNFLQVTSQDFELLISLIGERISKKDTNLHDFIPVKERLAVTLWFLTTGDSYKSLGYLLKISPSRTSHLVVEVCEALINELQNYIKMSCQLCFLEYKKKMLLCQHISMLKGNIIADISGIK